MASEHPHLFEVSKSVETVDTSLTANTDEVVKMADLIQNGRSPLAWYELVQGAIDYNDYSKGRPSIVYRLANGQDVNMYDYIGSKSPEKVTAVEIRNHLSAGNGLAPDNVVFVSHEGGEGTLGRWGRGLSIAATTLLAYDLSSGIMFSSADEHGVWAGRGLMTKRRADQRRENFVLQYTRKNLARVPDQTVISVQQPSPDLLATLPELALTFLPANPEYAHARLEGGEKYQKTKNRLEVYVNSSEAVDKPYFSDVEVKQFFGTLPQQTTEPARIEILSKSIGFHSTSAYVDGLRVRRSDSYYRFALNWSFYGFSDAKKEEYRIERSRDSKEMVGNLREIVSLALSKCEDSSIFMEIFHASEKDKYIIDANVNPGFSFQMTPAAQQAFAKAWEQLVQEKGFDPKRVLITTSFELQQRAEASGKQAILLQSDTLVGNLRAITGVKSVEDELRVKDDPKQTGEHMLVPNDISQEAFLADARKDLRATVGIYGVKVEGLEEGKIHVKVENSAISTYLQEYFYGLPPQIQGLARNLTAAMSDSGINFEITVDTGKKVKVYRFDKFRANSKNDSITILQGEKDTSGEPGINILIESENEAMREFVRQFGVEMGKYLESDGSVNRKRYLTSSDSVGDSLSERIQRREAQLRLMEGQLERFRFAKGGGPLGRKSGKTLEDLLASKRGKEISRAISTLPPEFLFKGLGSTWFGNETPDEGKPIKITDSDFYEVGEDSIENPYRAKSPGAEALRSHIKPILIGKYKGEKPKRIDYFIQTPQIPYSDLDSANFKIASDIIRDTTTGTFIAINRKLRPGVHPLPHLIGYRPVGYFHHEGAPLKFLEIKGKQTWVVQIDSELSEGLEIHFEKTSEEDTSLPDQHERAELAKIENLNPHWARLVEALRTDISISDKRKMDVLNKAWDKAFTYNDNYRGAKVGANNDFALAINNAEGNCADAARGLLALSRAVGIPSRMVNCQIAVEGKTRVGNGHALVQPYIDGKWPLVEPRPVTKSGYLNIYEAEDIPDEYEAIISRIPKGRHQLKDPHIVGRIVAGMAMAGIPAAGASFIAKSLVPTETIDRAITNAIATAGSTNPAIISSAILVGAMPAVVGYATKRAKRQTNERNRREFITRLDEILATIRVGNDYDA